MILSPKSNQNNQNAQSVANTNSSGSANFSSPEYSNGEGDVQPAFVNTGYDGEDEIGSLSARYESNGNPGTVSTGRGDKGGVSYGSYQLASKFDNPEKFLNSVHGLKYKPEFGGHISGSAAFSRVWRAIAAREPEAFQKAQHDYIKISHYDKMVDKVKSEIGLDILSRSRVFQDVAWSTAVHHGPDNNVFQSAFAGKNIEDASDEELIKLIYAERGKENSDGTLTRFSGNSSSVQAGVKKRFYSEQNDALNALFPDEDRTLTSVVGGKSTKARDWAIIQGWLSRLGYLSDADIQADSEDGSNPKTIAAIKHFQEDNKSVLGVVDGYIGRDSERVLLTALSNLENSDEHGSVETIQATNSTDSEQNSSNPNQSDTSATDVQLVYDINLLNNAMKGWGTDEKAVYKTLSKYKGSNQKINELKKEYKKRIGVDLIEQIHSEFSNSIIFGNELDEVLALIAITEAPKTETKNSSNDTIDQSAEPTPEAKAISASVGVGGVNKKVDVVLIQRMLNNAGANLVTDGLIGPKTNSAIKRYQSNFLRRPDGRVDVGGTTFGHLQSGEFTIAAAPQQQEGPDYESPTGDLSESERPTYEGIRGVYGEPGNAAEAQLVNVSCPFPIFYGSSPVSTIRIHKKVAGSFEAALNEVLSEYGLERLEELRIGKNYAGSFNNRAMRGGSQTSTHAWGVAVDFNHTENQLKWGSDRALFAKPEYAKFLDIMERHGWYNLGRYKNYDYMHFQAVRP